MGSYRNFKNFNSIPQPESSGGKPVGNFPLVRQSSSSIYSLTFDELQNSMSGVGKDFGSMNMDELLKSIWTAEETQVMGSFTNGPEVSTLQKQGSFSLPRTLSQKTVDEVWKDLLKESGSTKDGGGGGGSNVPQRQRTLGEMTLEEFLVRAGIVREDAQPTGRLIDDGFYGEISQPGHNSTGLTLGFQQPTLNNGVLANQTMENNNLVASSLGLNVDGARSSQQQQQPQQQLFPKQATLAFASPMHMVNNGQLASPGTRGAIVGMVDPPMKNALVQNAVIQNGAVSIAGLGSATTRVVAESPVNRLSTDVNAKNNGNSSSLSPVSYMFGEGARVRKGNGPVEKVVERRHRRMIKNRESAARSRARKQAYTLELEAEVAKLKEINQELQKKQEDIMEMQKNQISEAQQMPWGSKRQCLRRTLTGPW